MTMNTDYKHKIEKLIRNSGLPKTEKNAIYKMLSEIRSVRERNELYVDECERFKKYIECRKQAYE